MKIIIGVDLHRAYLPALHLVGKLCLRNAEVLLVQAAPTADSMLPPFPVDGTTVELIQRTFREAGEAALLEAEAEAARLGLPAIQLLCVGPSAELLNECVEREGAELVAVRTTRHGAWQSEFMGSVTRGVMLCGRASVLVAKQEVAPEGSVNAVFATDGSEFNDGCVEKFLSMGPTGIGAIHVVGAWGLSSQVEQLLRHALHHSADMDAAMRSEAQAGVERAAARLASAGYTTTCEAAHGMPDKVIHDAMVDRSADLLLVGAHGKNWFERLLIGSTSLHQVIHEPYNVLVLRP